MTASVVVATFNHARWLGQAIDSVLNQTLPDVEIIVVDDGSTDETPDVLAKYEDRIVTVRQQNSGLSAARNAGIAMAHGQYVAFLDADDLIDPEKLAAQTAILDREPRTGWVYSDVRIENETTGEATTAAQRFAYRTRRLDGWLFGELITGNFIIPEPPPGGWETTKRLLGPLRHPIATLAQRGRRAVFGRQSAPPIIATSDGFYEALGDVIHFPFQTFVRCRIPAIFNPHDLQHLHYPAFFRRESIEWREAVYRAGCAESAVVVADSPWVKRDIVRQYGIDPHKLYVIPLGAPMEFSPLPRATDLRLVAQNFQLPNDFVLYPAQSWPHKNHLGLLEALALLRERDGQVVHLICTGRRNDFWPTIEERVRTLRLCDQVRFVGFVAPVELRALYRLARCVIVPSLFEGGGMPILEAFSEGTPVACSNVTSLPEYGGDAVLLFDPTSAASISAAMLRLVTDDVLRRTLRKRGAERMRHFTWERTAKMYRALYRCLGGATLTAEDRDLLETAKHGGGFAGASASEGAVVGTAAERD